MRPTAYARKVRRTGPSDQTTGPSDSHAGGVRLLRRADRTTGSGVRSALDRIAPDHSDRTNQEELADSCGTGFVVRGQRTTSLADKGGKHKPAVGVSTKPMRSAICDWFERERQALAGTVGTPW